MPDPTTTKPKIQLDDIKTIVSQELIELNDFLSNQITASIPLTTEVVQHIMQSGGKRIRPLVVLLCTKATGARPDPIAIELAAIIELVHAATLLHDDVVDKSDLRRGCTTANAQFGNQAAVLVGDFLYSRAFQLLANHNNLTIIRLMTNTGNIITEGEVLQLTNQFDINLTVEQYNEVIYRKTAILFESAAQIAAITQTNNTAIHQAMAQYGKQLGITFQIIDDVLDYSIDATDLGKQLGDDLKTGKITLPLIHALKHSPPDTQHRLQDIIRQSDQSQFPQVIEALKRTEAYDYCYQQADHAARLAKKALEIIPDSPYKDALHNLVDFALARKY